VLEQLAGVFHLFERFSFREGSRLRALCAPFQEPARRPSRQLAQLTRVVAAMGARGNPVLWFLLNALLPWDLFLVHQLQRRQAAIAGQVSGWMRVWFRLEALGSLATYAYLNPHTSLPHMLSGAGEAVGPVFRAQAIGHPLLPEAEKVRNDFEVGGLGQVSLITGSNMAGKSVFLKTVGVNLALAQAGGPVDAALLVTIPLRLFSSLQVSDSVTGGLSYFYAEVKRLKALLDALERSRPTPLCFLIDEIFRGTNNRERLTGSRAYVRALAGKRGIGFIATHDLELARLAEEITPVKNYHFRDRVEKGRMTFDYKIRPGPSPTTNALKIMEIEGLPT
jgi:DNA mismatch repair ATPase MutS